MTRLNNICNSHPYEFRRQHGRVLWSGGYVEGQNVTVEYRWLEGKYDRLPEILADLPRQRAVIATLGNAPTQAASALTYCGRAMLISGRCHCGNISFALDWRPETSEIPARACTCSFCVKHGGV